jgi:hypothetical protein
LQPAERPRRGHLGPTDGEPEPPEPPDIAGPPATDQARRAPPGLA